MVELVGQVSVEDTGAPVPGLVVEAFDVARRAGGGGRDDESWLPDQPSLGADVTDAVGTFAVRATLGDGPDPRPVALAVLAPEGSADVARTLLHVVERRLAASGRHAYRITLPADAVRGLPGPGEAPAPSAARGVLAAASERAEAIATVGQGIARLRRDAVEQRRPGRTDLERRASAALFDRAVRQLRQPDGELPETVVPHGTSARSHSRSLLERTLGRRRPTVDGLVDVTDADAARLLDAEGQPLPGVTDDDVRRLLFGPGPADGPAVRYRRDPFATACRPRTLPALRDDQEADPGGSTGNGDGITEEGAPADAKLVKSMLGRLLRATELVPPTGDAAPRATPARIAEDLRRLTLQPGPADATALFDFERLFLAADLVVRPRPDPGRLADVLEATEFVAAAGGDLDGKAEAPGDLLDELEREATLLHASDPLTAGAGSASTAFMNLGGLGRTLAKLGSNLRDLYVDSGSEGPRPKQRDHRGTADHRDRDRPRPRPAEDRNPSVRDRFGELRGFLERLQRVRRADYPFTPFAADDEGGATTYGLVLGYRQRWEPTGYQAGELVRTLPLGPKATVRYTATRKTGRTYTDKRSEQSESSYRTEAQDVQRDVAKIVRDSKLSTSFNLTNQTGGGVPGAASSDTTSVWSVDAERGSQSTKDTFREQTRKHAEELKQRSSIEITLATADELEVEESSEISNPNDELVVTYLFYELQRKFLVSEHLERATPVVLVAQDLPAPSELDEEWLLRHDWVLRRVLLDGSFAPALDYASSGKLVADLGRAEELETTLDRQHELVTALEGQLRDLRSAQLLPDPRNVFEQFRVRVYDERHPGWREDEGRVREVFGDDVAERVAERRRSEERLEGELRREAGQLEQATTAYTDAFVRYATEAIQVERLLLHCKEHILYYQQAVWDHETPDQRFLRLRDQPVPAIRGAVRYRLEESGRAPRPPTWRAPLRVVATSELRLEGERPLGELADLTQPLGYVGNAMVFPLLALDPLAEFLLTPFCSAVAGIVDPDERGTLTLGQLDRLVGCLREQLPETEFTQLRPRIEAYYHARVEDPQHDAEEIVVPTESLFIEALTGEHPVLEDYKWLHRGVDVLQASSELVSTHLEQLRLAARLVGDVLDDPDIDRQVVVHGGDGVVVGDDE